jgi:predicted transcriptional regulator
MDDLDIARRIDDLADEEHNLRRAHTGEALSDPELERLRAIEVALDQCWDLLRQRRARRDAGRDPDDATVRAEQIVEGYQQ